MVEKNRQVIWRWKYTTKNCQGEKVYIKKKKKKEKANFVIPIENIKRHAIRAAKLQWKKCSIVSRAK